jgi:hypothetical protein
MIDIAEHETLTRICRFHNADNPELIEHLAELISWVHQAEHAKHGGEQPPFLIVLESLLGLRSCPRRGQQEADRGLVAV